MLVTFSCDNELFDSEYKKDESRLFDKYYGLVDNTSLEKADRLKYIDSMVDFTRNKPKDTLMRNHLIDISISYGRLGVQDSSFKYKHRALQLSTKINDSLGLAKSNYSLGLYHLNNDALDSAYTYFYNSEKLYDQIENSELGGTSALTMAITQKRVRDYVGAQESAIKAIELLEQTDEVRYLASAYNTLASVSRSLGKYESSIEYYTKVYDYREGLKKESLKKDDKLLNSSTLNNLGMVYMDMQEYPKAISNFKKGLSYDSLQIKKIKSYIRLIDNLGYAEYKNGNLESFPDLLLEALNKSREVNDRLAMVSSGMHLSEIYFEKGDTALSKYYAENAYKTAKEVTYNDGILGSLELLMGTSDPNDGIAYGKEYIRISDSLQMEERAFQNKFAQVRFETDKLEVAKNKATERSRILIIIFSISVIIFLIGYILLQRRNNRKELEYQEGQQKANEEIFNLMLAQQGKLEEGKHLAKQRISEELHDGILSRLFGLRLSLDSLNNKHGKEVETLRSSYIDQLKDLGQEIRKISHDLNNENFTQDTLYPDVLKKLLKDQFEAQHVTYEFLYDQTINWDLITNSKKVHVYRIIQECLMNINKHANAKHITVTFKSKDASVELTIEDDGVGMDTAKAKSGIGMKNIKSRVAQIAGSYKIISKMNLGTQIQISFN
ncbi:two-component sensor histidine kinase [Dokdonia pacifica]|uniref:tetratricopeptide repeat-containing sensor histidine kinase n=1 Tax=Dokdonia pacifica TaxID=1627892 RepID=UPI0015C68D95|nr:tetratricopeptide repeat-containing sensor histidine kinase [Dokdonia pacifica]GGG35568.1 two-component sensor histidine kinase [Dokdonia pacifica]